MAQFDADPKGTVGGTRTTWSVAGRKESRESRGKGENPRVSRARTEEAPVPALEVSRRIDIIVGMMQRDEWRPGDSAPALAAEWEVSPKTVESHAAEASRRVVFIARLTENPEELKSNVTGVLLRSLHAAHDERARGDVARIGDIVTKITGARAPERKDLRVEMSELEALAPPALRARLVDQIAKLTEALAKLDSEHPENVPKERT